MRKLFAIFIFVVCTKDNLLFSQTNLALNKRTDASTESAGYGSANSVDGNLSTYWAPADGTFPQWITVDLARISTLTMVKNTFLNNATWYYKIEASNTNSAEDFHLLADKTSTGATGTTIAETVTGNYRYLKLTITGCSLSGAWAASTELEVQGSILSQPTGVVPSIQAVSTGNLYVGSQMCNLWGSKYHWDNIRNPYIYNGRMPLMGWYDEAYDVSTDWTIKMAREHGISFFFPCWYRAYNNGGKPVMSQYDHFINSIANTATYRDSIKWAIQWINQETPSGITCTGYNDFTQNVVPFWIDNYFKKSNYFKIYNKPVVSIYNAVKFISDCGGLYNATLAIANLRTQCVNAGFDGAIVLTFYGNRYVDHLSTSPQVGDSIGVDFGYAYHLPTFADVYTSATPTDAQIIGWHSTAWSNYNANSGNPYIASVSPGWDDTPWGGFYGWQLASSSYATILRNAKDWANAQPLGTIPNKIVMLDNWNEFGEGHYIAPTRYYGYSFLDSVRSVFASAGAHVDSIPDVTTIPQLEPIPPVNLAFNKTVTTSSYAGAGYEGNKAVDGSLEYTKWVASGGSFPQWLKVDLGASYNIGKVKTIFYQNDLWKYKIEGSLNNTKWTTLANNTGAGKNGKIIDDSVSGAYRYIRITITGASNSWASIWEFEVFAAGGSSGVANSINLAGKNEGVQNILQWKMSGNLADYRYFEVQRSGDNITFDKVGAVNLVLDKTIGEYIFSDTQPLKGRNFYQVIAQSASSSAILSNIITLDGKQDENFSIRLLPNPATTRIRLEIKGELNPNAKLEILNINGELIQTILLKENFATISTEHFSSGVYLFRYSDDKRSRVEKIVKN